MGFAYKSQTIYLRVFSSTLFDLRMDVALHVCYVTVIEDIRPFVLTAISLSLYSFYLTRYILNPFINNVEKTPENVITLNLTFDSIESFVMKLCCWLG